MQLQLRSAISHINEVWAIEAGGVMLSAFADVLPWEWIRNSARWTYDESRHCRMGYERLMAWDLNPAEIPLGTYIYESASGRGPDLPPRHALFFRNQKYPAQASPRPTLPCLWGRRQRARHGLSTGPMKPCTPAMANTGSRNSGGPRPGPRSLRSGPGTLRQLVSDCVSTASAGKYPRTSRKRRSGLWPRPAAL